MIEQRATGVAGHPIMILGVVVTIKDLAGQPGGKTIAKLAVAEHPAGYAPLVTRLRFWREPQGAPPPYFEFRSGRRYVVVARRLPDKTYESDLPCGRTSELGRSAFHDLVRLARA